MNLATFESTPDVRLARSKAAANTADWTPGCWSGEDRQGFEDDEEADDAVKAPISMFSTAMDNLNQVKINAARVSLVMFQLKPHGMMAFLTRLQKPSISYLTSSHRRPGRKCFSPKCFTLKSC